MKDIDGVVKGQAKSQVSYAVFSRKMVKDALVDLGTILGSSVSEPNRCELIPSTTIRIEHNDLVVKVVGDNRVLLKKWLLGFLQGSEYDHYFGWTIEGDGEYTAEYYVDSIQELAAMKGFTCHVKQLASDAAYAIARSLSVTPFSVGHSRALNVALQVKNTRARTWKDSRARTLKESKKESKKVSQKRSTEPWKKLMRSTCERQTHMTLVISLLYAHGGICISEHAKEISSRTAKFCFSNAASDPLRTRWDAA